MSASHPKATESLRSSEMTLSARTGREQSQQNLYSITSSAREQHRRYVEVEHLGGLVLMTNRGLAAASVCVGNWIF
jgi:hypothetical protein